MIEQPLLFPPVEVKPTTLSHKDEQKADKNWKFPSTLADVTEEPQRARIEHVTDIANREGLWIEGWIARVPGNRPSLQRPIVFTSADGRMKVEVEGCRGVWVYRGKG